MPKTNIDYSNTVFYKIYCKDIDFHDVYIGHTTNFVQRKHAHKRACNKSTDQSHHLKVYKIIREHGGWDNWNMEMIGFRNCKDHSEACTIEQEYFDSYKASLNSILAKKQVIERLPMTFKEKEKLNLFCDVCKIKSCSQKAFEIHKKTNKHKSLVEAQNNNETEIPHSENIKFHCELCDFKCTKKSNYEKHLLTLKHQKASNTTKLQQQHKCECGKIFSHRGTLWNHKNKHCNLIKKNADKKDSLGNATNDEISVLRDLIYKQQEQIQAQQENIRQQQEEHNKQITDIILQLKNRQES